MIGDAFVFDGVAHPFNFEADNARGPAGQMFSNHLYAFHTVLTPQGQPLMSAEEFLHKWSVEEIHEMVYGNSDTDMLVAMPLPLTDMYKDGLSPWTECAKLAQLDPDRTVMWGTVNPLEGKAALDDLTRQVEEYGAKAFKFYNVRYEDGGQVPWRMDDPKVAFPIFERIQELGVNLVGVHKGVPLGPQMIEHTQTWDMDGAAANFPDINFVVRSPRLFAELLGKLLFWCGEDKIIYGSEAPIWQPQWALEAFWNFEIPQDLTDGYGYPQLTEQAKKKILGENLLKLHGMDVAETRARLGKKEGQPLPA
jgi:hypothetical protein